MSFSGKATFSAGAELPELMEDVADLVSVVSPWETPLLDALGDPKRAATSTVHEWIEDTLLPNTDTVAQTTFTPDPQGATQVTVSTGPRFQIGDLVRPGNSQEIMLVTGVSGNVLTVTRRYGGTPASSLSNGLRLTIIANAALEGQEAAPARFTNRTRRQNFTQIFAATVELSGTMQAVRAHGVDDELEFQKQERLRELLRDLENCVINGVAPAANQQGSAGVRRSMNGLIRTVSSNQFVPGQGGMPAGGGAGSNELTESLLNTAMRLAWEQSSGRIDTIVVNSAQKRRINQFISSTMRHTPMAPAKFSEVVSAYESDFGVCRIVLSRWMPSDAVLLLDSSRVEVLPLASRSFHFKPLASTGDSVSGQVIGEYTVEMRNENAHAVIRGLAA